jgi:hypothetical protein
LNARHTVVPRKTGQSDLPFQIRLQEQGCQICFDTIYQTGKIYQIATKLPSAKWQWYIPNGLKICQPFLFQGPPKLARIVVFWSENKPFGNPVHEGAQAKSGKFESQGSISFHRFHGHRAIDSPLNFGLEFGSKRYRIIHTMYN